MTTAIERLRALHWGAQLLEAIQVEPDAELSLRRRAADAARTYPAPARLKMLLAAPHSRFPRDLADAVFQTGFLFAERQQAERLSPETRRLWQSVNRHYPNREAGWHQPEDFEHFDVDELFAQEEREGRHCPSGATSSTASAAAPD